jgi:transcriptional regulator with XRE-family HTH domain
MTPTPNPEAKARSQGNAGTLRPEASPSRQGPLPLLELYEREDPIPITELKARGLTQQTISKLLGVTKAAVSQWISGAREIPLLVLVDLWELFRVVEERMLAGADVHAAVDGWQPTVILTPKDPPDPEGLAPVGQGPRIGTGMGFPTSEAMEEARARRDVPRMEQEALQNFIRLLADEYGQPLTAERLMRIRRLAIGVKLTAETSLLMLGGLTDASYQREEHAEESEESNAPPAPNR